jgi:predicted MPP superfamily phosphohydrolase
LPNFLSSIIMKISRRTFLKSAGLVALGSCAGLAGGYQYGRHVESYDLGIEHIEVPFPNLPSALEGLKIVQLSDIHLHPFIQIDFVQRVVTTANALQPDLVVLTGDYVLKQAESIFELGPVLASLNARYGVFTILGNHDLWTNRQVVQQGLAEAGLPVLHNEGMSLAIGQDRLYLAGVDDGWSGQPDLKAALAQRPSDIFTLLLAHEPDLADDFAQDGRVSLQLSGHSHGGQVRLPGLGAPVLPFLGKKYDQGLFKVKEMQLYTTRGIGLTVPIRLNCPPEITELTLVRA